MTKKRTPGKIRDVPKATRADRVHAVVKAALGIAPGGPELFEAVITSPLEKRRDEWRRDVTEAVRELQERLENFDPRKLGENQMFVTAVAEAGFIAIRNHSKEKRQALLNAIQNSALQSAPDEELQLLFLALVDSLTPMHLRLLKLFSEPQSNPRIAALPHQDYSASQIAETAFPDFFRANPALADVLIRRPAQPGVIDLR